MNIVVYLLLWAEIGLIIGFLANWISETDVWPWFWIDLCLGCIGAVLCGYYVTVKFFGIAENAYSFLFAIIGSVLLLWLSRFFTKKQAKA